MALSAGLQYGPLRSRDVPDSLRLYLLQRDRSAPAAVPVPAGLAQTVTGASRIDVISWNYEQPDPTLGLPADGFVVWVEVGDSAEPVGCGYLLDADARSFTYVAPGGVAMSYAVQAFRLCHEGIVGTAKVTTPSWQGATGGSSSSAGRSLLYPLAMMGG